MREAKMRPVAIAQPARGKKTKLRDKTLEALIKSIAHHYWRG